MSRGSASHLHARAPSRLLLQPSLPRSKDALSWTSGISPVRLDRQPGRGTARCRRNTGGDRRCRAARNRARLPRSSCSCCWTHGAAQPRQLAARRRPPRSGFGRSARSAPAGQGSTEGLGHQERAQSGRACPRRPSSTASCRSANGLGVRVLPRRPVTGQANGVDRVAALVEVLRPRHGAVRGAGEPVHQHDADPGVVPGSLRGERLTAGLDLVQRGRLTWRNLPCSGGPVDLVGSTVAQPNPPPAPPRPAPGPPGP